MKTPGQHVVVATWPRAIIAVAMVLGALASPAGAVEFPAKLPAPATQPATTRPAAITDGLRVFVAGHSFHVFIGRTLADVAKAAGIQGHANAGVQSIGGSSVLQHWNMPDEKNKAKQALIAGSVDVLTVSPAWTLPDEGIDRFVELAVKHNPNVRVIVQQSWMGYDAIDPPLRIKDNAERDQKTVEQLREPLDKYRKVLEEQVRAINRKHERPVVFIAPVGDAMLALRERVIAGTVPGIRTQSELFTDPIGHGKETVQRLAAYTQFAVIYRRSPVGLTAFERPNDGEDARRLNRLLQELAWDAALNRPLSGLSAEPAGGAASASGDASGQPATRPVVAPAREPR